MRGEDRLAYGTRWLNRLWIGRPSMGVGAHETVEQGVAEHRARL